MHDLKNTSYDATKLLHGENDILLLMEWKVFIMPIKLMEFLHIGFGIPWWTVIANVTMIARVLLFVPAMVLHSFTRKLVKITRNRLAKYGGNKYHYEKKGNVTIVFGPMDTIPRCLIIFGYAWYVAMETLFFVTAHTSLLIMSSLPVKSMKTGGLWWFKDLTVPDSYYVLPLINIGFIILITVASDMLSQPAYYSERIGKFLVALPVIFYAHIAVSYPAAFIWHWIVSNCLLLVQVTTMTNSITAVFINFVILEDRTYVENLQNNLVINVIQSTLLKSALNKVEEAKKEINVENKEKV